MLMNLITQTEEPLVHNPDWLIPERTNQRGRFLVLGASNASLLTLQKCFDFFEKNGVNEVKFMLPKGLIDLVHGNPKFFAVESDRKDSFDLRSYPELLGACDWADCVLIPGGVGRNSETSRCLEKILEQSSSRFVLVGDCLEPVNPGISLGRANTTIVASLSQLQRMNLLTKGQKAIKLTDNHRQLIETIAELSENWASNVITLHGKWWIAASKANLARTLLDKEPDSWRLHTALLYGVWSNWIENTDKCFSQVGWTLKDVLNS